MATRPTEPVSEAVSSEAQSRVPPTPAIDPSDPLPDGAGTLFHFGKRLMRAGKLRSYAHRPGDPLYRTLSIYALDPSVSKLGGAIAKVKIPYEALGERLCGAIVEVDNTDANGTAYPAAELDSIPVLLNGGYTPSLSRPEFHQQMVYAVTMLTYANFKLALGREVPWAIAGEQDGSARLRLRPFGANAANAWYDRERGEIIFGYFTATQSRPLMQAGQSLVYTSLSHDIIVHEASHALLDGLRAHFFEPTHADVLAFHEAFADLIAFFQHFAYPDVVRSALSSSRGGLANAEQLVSLAQEFGRAIGVEGPGLRTFVKPEAHCQVEYDESVTDPHTRGQALTRAIFCAFDRLYQRRIRRYVRLATGGSGVLPDGELSELILEILVDEASKLASQFLTICIRAIDYCPPVDVRFGDYLRALITADIDLVPDDALAYREAIIEAFGSARIYGEGVDSMSEDALQWRKPRTEIVTGADLKLGALHLSDDLADLHDRTDMMHLAGAIGRLAADPVYAREFGLVSPRAVEFVEGETGLPTVESVRIARRIGPDRQIAFDLVAEVTQRVLVRRDGKLFPFYGGATVILDSTGKIRFIISKRVDHEGRRDLQWDYMHRAGARFWSTDPQAGMMTRTANIAKRLCQRDHSA
ncbi:gluzincin family metallopeptidase [Novosphingobium soli]|uniref:Peptidase M4 n=1 Tax=Novosphingobium soli TaxID=574956 RepID=A0ABV6CZN7_9SPHN